VKKIIICLSVFTFLTLCLLCSPSAKAASQGIQISPINYAYEISPGSSTNAQFIISNVTDQPMSYVLETENFTNVSDDGAPSFGGVSEPEMGITTLKDWINIPVSDKEGTIAPGDNKMIQFSIDIPLGADPGGHYAALFAKQITKTPEGKTVLGVQNRVGALVLVTVPGNVTKGAEISDFTYTKFFWKNPAEFSMKVKNTGSVHYDSQAKVTLTSLLGKKSEVDLGKHTIIPKFSRDYSGKWSKKYPFGIYKISATATDGSGKEITTTGVLWAIPIMIVIPAVVILALIVWFIIYLRRHLRFQ
jgi:hypothetical protein